MALPAIEGLERLDDAECARLRGRLAAAGYDGAFLAEVEDVAPRLLDALRRPVIEWWLGRQAGPAADLAWLFCYGGRVATERLEGPLGADLVARLCAAGVLVPDGGASLRSAFLLVPFDGLWFLSDPLERGGDATMGPGMTTVLLHRVLPEVLGGSVLDLGCGSGSLAIDAARRGARAVATDVSARALEIARFNARLNGVPLDVRRGDVEAPAMDERFDLVVAQPPYVPRPVGQAATTYLHGGAWGDELAMRFVTGAARVLAPGGIALLHFDSAVRPDEPLLERLRAATGEAPVELLAYVSPGPPPDVQAILYAGSDHPGLGESFAREAVENREHLERLGVREISRVLVVLRRPRGGDVPGGRYRIVLASPPFGSLRPGEMRGALEALDLASGTDEALLAARVAPPAGATFVGEWRSPADEAPARLEVTFAAGSLAQDRELGDRGWLLCGLLDGTRTVREAIAPYAEACEAEPAAAAREVVGFVREGLARGLLRPVAAGA